MFSLLVYKNVYNSKTKWDIFTKFDTHMYGHTLRTHTKFGGIGLLGGAIIEQNMKLPLTTTEYYDIKCYILRLHWCTITKLCIYHQDHDLKVRKTFWDSATLWSKVTMKFQINANSFLWILPIVMRLVLIDSLGHAENSDTNVAIVSQTSSPPFWFSLKTYFFKLLLDCWSDFHQIESYYLRTMLTKSNGFCVIDKTVLAIPQKRIWGMMPKWHLKLYLCNALAYWHQTCVCAIVNSYRTHHVDLITAPPIGQTW